MQKYIFLSLLFVTLYSYPDEIDRIPLPDFFYQRIVVPLLPEVGAITNLPIPTESPIIYISTRENIQKLYCENSVHACGVAAVTEQKTGQITLSRELIMMKNIATQSVIFHELVHWLQIKNHLFENETECVRWAKSEIQAYNAQSKFLELYGENKVKVIIVPNLLSQCN